MLSRSNHWSENSTTTDYSNQQLQHMKEDELHHATPKGPVMLAMKLSSRIITKSVYWL